MREFKDICEIEACTGCMACYNICNKHAIIMQSDKEGFLRPYIDDNKCINCKKCIHVCPVNRLTEKLKPIEVYSGWSNNDETRMNSSSGGAFIEIAKIIISQKKGVVFGCALDNQQKAYHTYVTEENDLKIFQGSKYVQSYIGDSYYMVKQFLDKHYHVLFSGTPCQIAGLRNYLHKEYELLYTIDIICHGVPSPLIFEEYKKYLERQNEDKISHFKFRNKKYSWFFFNVQAEFKGLKKTYIGTYYGDPYLRGFLRDLFLRPSCHQCKYTTINRLSDFTIADWWGYKRAEKKDKDFFRKGVSLVMANTEKAKNILKKTDMYLRPQTLDNAKKTNKCLSNCFPKSNLRIKFWEDYYSGSFDSLVKKYMYPEKGILIGSKILNNHVNGDVLLFFTIQLNRMHRILRKYF